MSQASLSRESGVPQASISEIENSAREASVATYQRLARALRAPIDLLLPHLPE